MSTVQTIASSLVIVVAMDWIFVSRLAAFFSDFDYRYWPPTWQRFATVLLAIVTTAVSALVFTPGNMPIWRLFVWVIVFGLWMIVAVDDIARQRSIGFRTPPRYSDEGD